MQEIIEDIKTLFASFSDEKIVSVGKIPQSGSIRIYFRIITENDSYTIYVQQDFGDVSLLNQLEEKGFNDYVYALFKQSLQQLAYLQIKGDEDLDYDWCLTSKEFGKQAILSDLLYFKYYFLDT